MKKIDIMEKEDSLTLLIEYLKKETEPLITNRSYVLINRYLRGWEGLYLANPPRLTLEGGTLLLKEWVKDIRLSKGGKK